MLYFLGLWLLVTLLIMLFALIGVGFISPFARYIRFPLLAAPLAGLLILPFLANLSYSVLALRYRPSIAIGLVVALVVLALTRRCIVWRDNLPHLVAGSLIASLAALLLADGRSLLEQGPAIFIKYGTDQHGYAHLADWLLDHTPTGETWDPNPAVAYESWPSVMLSWDPRFGTFGYLAFISAVTKKSSLFAYPFAASLAIACAALSLIGLYARSLFAVAICVPFLLIAHWVDYSFMGFLGRIIGYPAALYLAGFVIVAFRAERWHLASLLLLAAAAGSAYPGVVIAVLASAIFLPFAVLLWFEKGVDPARIFVPAACSLLTPIVASGVASRPVAFVAPNAPIGLMDALGRALEFKNAIVPLYGIDETYVPLFVAISLGALLVQISLSVVQRNKTAACLATGPFLLMAAFLITGRWSSISSLSGYFYPALVCSAAALMGPFVLTWKANAVLWPLFAQGLIRAPRIVTIVQLFGYSPDFAYVFTRSEVRALEREVEGKTVLVDLGSRTGEALVLLNHLGRTRPDLQWSQETWKSILGYRRYWTYNQPLTKPERIITWSYSGDVHKHFSVHPN